MGTMLPGHTLKLNICYVVKTKCPNKIADMKKTIQRK